MRIAEFVTIGLAVLMVAAWKLGDKRHEWLASFGITLAWVSLALSVIITSADPTWTRVLGNVAALVLIWVASRRYKRDRKARRVDEPEPAQARP
jgi:threonine/homoserine/homoserine lactone efflux protein